MKTLLVPVDFSPITSDLIEATASLAQAMKARIVLLHVVSPPILMSAYRLSPSDITSQIKEEEDRARKELEREAAPLRQAGLDTVADIREGSTVESIVQAAEEHGADFLVIGSHGHGAVYDLLVGSTARGILRQAKCPVLVIPHAVHHDGTVARA